MRSCSGLRKHARHVNHSARDPEHSCAPGAPGHVPCECTGVVWLEEEQPARLQGLEFPLASGTPEVDLLDPGQAPQEAEPAVVRDSDPELHGEP